MIQQLAVFLENKEGRAGDCCKVLKEANVNLYSLSIADTKEFGILRVIADDNEKALAALQKAGFLSTIVQLIGVEVPNTSGALADILIALENGGVNVEYMYSFAGTDNHAQIAFKTGTPEKALAALNAVGAKVL